MPNGRDGSIRVRGRWIALLSLLTLLCGGYHPADVAAAAPGPVVVASHMRAAPDWMSEDTAARLDLRFDVLVPGWVPAPFSGEPRVAASDGSYSLYWMVPGGPPTFLEITGTVGGTIPDFSWYDRNNELVQNAEVQGYPAYHDVTPAYDLIYWQVDGVVYSVNSQNLAETDSLSLANALEALSPPVESGGDGGPVDDGGSGEGDGAPVDVPPPSLGVPESVESGETASIDVEGVSGALLKADAGSFVETGEDTYAGAGGFAVEWRAPETTDDLTVTFVVVDPDTGEWLASASTVVLGAPVAAQPVSASLVCPEVATGGALTPITLYGGGSLVLDVTHGSWPSQSPNTLFDPDADGGGTLVGELPDDGSASVVWRVPDISAPVTAYIYATDVNGETAECAVAVEPGDANDGPSGSGAGDQVEPDPTSTDEGSGPPASEPSHNRDSPAGSDVALTGADGRNTSLSTTSATGADRAKPTATVEPRLSTSQDGPRSSGGESLATTPTERAGDKAKSPTSTRNEVPGTPEAPGSPSPTNAPLPSVPASVVLPTATAISTPVPDESKVGEVTETIGPAGGTVTSPAGAKLTVPPGAFEVPLTVRIRPVPDAWLPVSPDVELIPGTGFDVTVSTADGTPVRHLSRPVELSLAVNPDEQTSRTTIFWVDEEHLERLDGSLPRPGAVAAPLDHFSRFVAGASIHRNRTLFPWIILALVLLVLLVVGGIASSVWGRRPRPAAPRVRSTRQ